jgi:hypothetical protein
MSEPNKKDSRKVFIILPPDGDDFDWFCNSIYCVLRQYPHEDILTGH